LPVLADDPAIRILRSLSLFFFFFFFLSKDSLIALAIRTTIVLSAVSPEFILIHLFNTRDTFSVSIHKTASTNTRIDNYDNIRDSTRSSNRIDENKSLLEDLTLPLRLHSSLVFMRDFIVMLNCERTLLRVRIAWMFLKYFTNIPRQEL